jgi:hypothetical protein
MDEAMSEPADRLPRSMVNGPQGRGHIHPGQETTKI